MRKKTVIIFLIFGLLITFFISCSHIESKNSFLDSSKPQLYELLDGQLTSSLDEDYYTSKVQPIFNKRCIACHACGEAPCSLYLTSYEGMRRGSRLPPDLLLGTTPFRLKDVTTVAEWRDRGFKPVVHNLKGEEYLAHNLIYQFAKQRLDSGFENLSLPLKKFNEPKTCEGNFHIGMPYGLPPLSNYELDIIKTWAQDGSVGPSPRIISNLNLPSNPQLIRKWENFLNNSNPKAQLFIKYIYEHSFLAHIHFDSTPNDEFFELVRSRTVAPFPVDEIVTERPSDPVKDKIYFYRLKKVTESIVKKTHIPWEVSEADKINWINIIEDAQWSVSKPKKILNQELPILSDNPFDRFKDIPTKYRYKFLLENSYMIVNSMIKGPVCVGLNATSAIRDHFWVLFLKPEADKTLDDPELKREWKSLVKIKNPINVLTKSALTSDVNYDINSIWDGDGYRQNALLTIFRHEESASVHKGFIGGQPNTIWFLNYSNFERIYYNLVVEFKPWGSALHQLSTFDAMTEHRKEAEERFLLLFPKNIRQSLYNQFEESFFESNIKIQEHTKSPYENQYILNFLNLLNNSLKPEITNNHYDFIKNPSDKYNEWELAFEKALIDERKSLAKHLPNITYIQFEDEAYTLLRTKYYKFNDIALVQDYGRNPNLDSLIILKGIIGDRPEVFLKLNFEQKDEFLKIILDTSTPGEIKWINLKKRYAITRFNSNFWSVYDWFNTFILNTDPLEAGAIDLNQLELN